MPSKNKKLDNLESTSSQPLANEQLEPLSLSESGDSPVRLSSKGSTSEDDGQNPFDLNLEVNSRTSQFEKDSLLKEQLESVDFYIEQGFLEVAFSTLERLEMVFPNHPSILEKLDKMANLEKQGVVTTDKKSSPKEIAPSEITDLSEPFFRVPNTAELPKLEESDTGEVEILFEENIEEFVSDDQASSDKGKEDSEQTLVVVAIEPNDNSQTLEDVPYFDEIVAEPLAKITVTEDIPEEFYNTVNDDLEDVINSQLPATQNSFQSLFEELEGEMDESTESDFLSHFNVGLSYYEIELFDDAIEEFQAAYRTVQNVKNHPQLFTCFQLLGRCFRIKGIPRPSLIWLRRALEIPGRKEEEYLEVKYDLACVHEELGEKERAIELFEEIAKVNPAFQNVPAKLAELRS